MTTLDSILNEIKEKNLSIVEMKQNIESFRENNKRRIEDIKNYVLSKFSKIEPIVKPGVTAVYVYKGTPIAGLISVYDDKLKRYRWEIIDVICTDYDSCTTVLTCDSIIVSES